MRPFFAFLCGIFAVTQAVHAEDSGAVTLQLVPHGEAIKGRLVAVSARRVQRPSDIEHGDFTIERSAHAGESLTADLAPGYWLIRTDGPSVWRSSQVIAAEHGKTFLIDVWPSSTVEGSVKSDGAAPLKEISLYFKRVPDAVESPESGEITAPVTDGKFRCALPAGTFDLRLHAPSHISHFFWHQVIGAGATADLGKTVLKQGQAIFGRVELPRGVKADLSKATVQALPPAMGEGLQPLVVGGALLVSSAKVTPAGDFQIEGLPPGLYTLTAHSCVDNQSSVGRCRPAVARTSESLCECASY